MPAALNTLPRCGCPALPHRLLAASQVELCAYRSGFGGYLAKGMKDVWHFTQAAAGNTVVLRPSSTRPGSSFTLQLEARQMRTALEAAGNQQQQQEQQQEEEQQKVAAAGVGGRGAVSTDGNVGAGAPSACPADAPPCQPSEWHKPASGIAHLHGWLPRGLALPPLQPGEWRCCGLTFHPHVAPAAQQAVQQWLDEHGSSGPVNQARLNMPPCSFCWPLCAAHLPPLHGAAFVAAIRLPASLSRA
jgi:hypothetical protein